MCNPPDAVLESLLRTSIRTVAGVDWIVTCSVGAVIAEEPPPPVPPPVSLELLAPVLAPKKTGEPPPDEEVPPVAAEPVAAAGHTTPAGAGLPPRGARLRCPRADTG